MKIIPATFSTSDMVVYSVIQEATGEMIPTPTIKATDVVIIPTPTLVTIEASETITVSLEEAGTAFGGQLIIGIDEIKSYNNEVTAILSSPGYPEKEMIKKVSQKDDYVSDVKYEIQVMGFTENNIGAYNGVVFIVRKIK